MKLSKSALIALGVSANLIVLPAGAQSYGPYDKDAKFFASGEFCQKVNAPEVEIMLQASNTSPSNYWRNIAKGWYSVRLLNASGDPTRVAQLRAAYSVMQKAMTRCGL